LDRKKNIKLKNAVFFPPISRKMGKIFQEGNNAANHPQL
jgi:hypothetical protein